MIFADTKNPSTLHSKAVPFGKGYRVELWAGEDRIFADGATLTFRQATMAAFIALDAARAARKRFSPVND